MALRELSSLEKYLGLKKPNKYSTQGDKKVPVLQNNNGPPLVGLVTIACHLVKEAKRPELLGDSTESRAVVQQWLEYRVTNLNGCTKDDMKTVLKDLNIYLQDKAYLAKNQFTLADILMYYGIQPLIVSYLFCHLFHPYLIQFRFLSPYYHFNCNMTLKHQSFK
uniref:Eukaryotic translation elongation factor 1 epsilon 1 n=1 Tax=Lates calcarifer TaxID=8187 RepID=A0A4W6D1H3_LATCA